MDDVILILKILLVFFLKIGPTFLVFIIFCIIIYFWSEISLFLTSIFSSIKFFTQTGKSQVNRLTIQSQINQSISGIEDQVPGLFDKGVRVKWLAEEEEHININKKGIFIRIKETQNSDSIFLKALTFMTDNDLLINSREYIHGHILEGIKLVLIEKMLLEAGFKSALAKFKDESFIPVISNSKSIENSVRKLEYLDYQGLFTRVFLRECSELATLVELGHKNSGSKWDVTSFLDFTNTLFLSLDNEEIKADFEYSSSTIKVAFAILADELTWKTRGLSFYKKRTLLSISRGATVIYIVAIGKRNVQIANNLSRWLVSEKIITKRFVSNYKFSFSKNSNLPASCIRCEVDLYKKQASLQESVEDHHEVIVDDQTLHDYIKYIINDEDIEIIKSAWIKGYQAQVVVKSKNKQKNALRICIGRDGITAKSIQELIGNDFVRFIEWSSDIKSAILGNLNKYNDQEINDIYLDPKNRIATIIVQSQNTIQDLSGPEEKSKMIAEELTEYSIEFQIDPREIINKTITRVIPEIRTNEIQINNLVVIGDEEARILVSSEKISTPAQICSQYITEIKRLLSPLGRIYFCNYKKDFNEQIVASLYPLWEEDVIEVKMIAPDHYSVMVKNHNAASRAVGINGIHIRAAIKLLHVRIDIITPKDS